MYSWKVVVDRISEGDLKDLYIIDASNPDERITMKLELARIVLDNLKVRIEENSGLCVEISKEEKEDYKEVYDLYMVGKLLKEITEVGVWKYIFTIGGLRFIVSTPTRLELLSEMDKVYIGIRVSR